MDIASLLLGFVLGIVSSFVAGLLWDRATRPFLKISVDSSQRAQGQVPENPPHEFFHLTVANRPADSEWVGRRPAWACKATLEIVSQDGAISIIAPFPARWTSQLEPVLAVGVGSIVAQIPDVARM